MLYQKWCKQIYSKNIYNCIGLAIITSGSAVSYALAVESVNLPMFFGPKLYEYPKDNFGLRNVGEFALSGPDFE